jgi:hypothetical protein
MEPDLSDCVDALAACIANIRKGVVPVDEARIGALEDRLAKLRLALIVAELHDEQADYTAALGGIQNAIAKANDALAGIAEVSKAIDTAADAVSLVDKALSVVV